jgi:hypothetical protein
MATETPYKVDAWTGEKVPYTAEELDALHLRALNQAFASLGIDGERAVEQKLAPRWRNGSYETGQGAIDEVRVARHNATLEVAQKELARQEAAAAAAEAAMPSADELARARVLRIHERKLQARLLALSVADRATWTAEVAICNAGVASARVRNSAAETAIFEARLAELGALPPAEDDLAALLEPEITAAGIDGSAHTAEVERLRAKHNLGADLKPIKARNGRTQRV